MSCYNIKYSIINSVIEQVTEDDMRDLMFSTALDVDAEDDRKYEEVTMEQLLNAAVLVLEEYNATHKKKMNIVLFKYVS